MIHPHAYAHFRDLSGELSTAATTEQLDRLRTLLLAALDCAYSAASERCQLQERLVELEQTVTWQRAAIEELTQDRQMLATVIEEAACMPPLFTYTRLAAGACR
jgi:hypothetical protein